MSSRGSDGATAADHYRAAARAGHAAAQAMLDRLEAPPPYGSEHLWRWFLDLHGRRGSNGYGPNPLDFREIQAWAAVAGLRPAPWEIEVITALDDAYLRHQAEQARAERDRTRTKTA
ncbi:MAG TPA: hypothetical protein VGE72_29995 [Azospirillum sp.]